MGLSRNISTRCVQEGKFLVWNAMIILISLLILGYTQAEIRIVNTPSSIKALLGQNLTIPCLVTHNDNQGLDFDLSTVSVLWTKRSSSGVIHDVYKYLGPSDEQIRLGSHIEENALKRGNASLTLHHVQTSDEGEYTCTVFITPVKAATNVKVHILERAAAASTPTQTTWTTCSQSSSSLLDPSVDGTEIFTQPVVTLSSTELIVEQGREESLTCEVTRLYPEVVKIRWVKYSRGSGTRSSLDRATCLSVPEENSDGTFNIISLLTVRPVSLEEDGDVYSCTVTHESFNQDHKINFTLTVKEPPTNHLLSIITPIVFLVVILIAALYLYFMKLPPRISDIAGIDDLVHAKRSNLSWMVSGFKPRDIEICAYLERGDQRREIGSWKYPTPQGQDYNTLSYDRREGTGLINQEDSIQPLTPKSSFFSYNCVCSINITPDKKKDEGCEVVIEIKHASLKTLLTTRRKLNIKGDYFTAHITAPQCLKHGEEVTLTCDITKCEPKPLLISWLKGKQVIYKDGKIQDTRYTHTETRDVPHEGNVLKSSSSLTFTAKVKEDHGVTYTCRVAYSAIGDILKPCHETLITAQPVVEQITSEHVGGQMKLSCRVHSFYPQTIEIKWFKEEEELPKADCELYTDEDGLYSTTSILMYVPEMEDIGKTFRCQVDHQSLPNPKTCEWKLEDQRKNDS